MRTVPIVFSFDNNLILPACVCISSLMMNAKNDTFYKIYIIHSESIELRRKELDSLPIYYSNCSIQYVTIGDDFEKSFEIRGITVATYYRLLIPELIPQHDTILYSDVDVIFRSDLADIYYNTNMNDAYFAGVNTLFSLMKDTKEYYEKQIKIPAENVIYAGNLIVNSKKIREDCLIPKFKIEAKKNYKFQDLDIINIVCKEKIKQIEPWYCLSTYITEFALKRRVEISFWKDEDIKYALNKGIIHYNGQKPWIGYCLHFDIWWEYYRKSPFYDEQFYFDFFKRKMDDLEYLSLTKRIKILIRWFFYRKK